MFKPAGKSIIAIDADGDPMEWGDRDEEFETLADWAKQYEVEKFVKIIIFDPFSRKPHDRPFPVEDVTSAVATWWVNNTDMIWYDDHVGCPAIFTEDEWDDIIAEEKAETDDEGEPLYRSDDWWDAAYEDARDRRNEGEL